MSDMDIKTEIDKSKFRLVDVPVIEADIRRDNEQIKRNICI